MFFGGRILTGKILKQLTSKSELISTKVSPDGKYIFCFSPDAEKDAGDLITSFKLHHSFSGRRKNYQTIRLHSNAEHFQIVEWKQDSKAFLIVEKDQDKTTLSVQLINAEKPTILKEWKTENIYQIAISKDGKRLFYEKGEEVTSIIELKDIAE